MDWRSPIPADEVLFPGDEVWLQYWMIDKGSWIDDLNASLVEQSLLSDPRFVYLGYTPEDEVLDPGSPPTSNDPSDVGYRPRVEAHYLVFHVRYVGESDATSDAGIQRAGFMGQAILLATLAATIAASIYAYHRVSYLIQRQTDLMTLANDPNQPASIREAAVKAMGETADKGIIGEAAAAAGGTFAVAVLLAVAYLVFGRD